MPEMGTRSEEPDDALSAEIGIETPEADAAEQHRPVREEASDRPGETSAETPEADAAEQSRTVNEDGPEWPDHIPLEADPADTAEQSRTVETGEDDYR
ncbi:hypothetical protein OHA77_26185 [Streptosporangium sp. NBC_01639]|uniref:hypothetical protein n=1 Tax=Streptosporangium sp. NBC_01639 TaxID=2975948 RepID=UPI00386A36C7|nr:hypothetical protein OHA77_26185 [Streptosporangium sp. NBC_01639]